MLDSSLVILGATRLIPSSAAFSMHKMRKQTKAARASNRAQQQPKRSSKARRKTKSTPRPEHGLSLLTVTLDAIPSACVRRFAEEFGEEVQDVASGAILDTLPQALNEWEDTKECRRQGIMATATYWRGTADEVSAARVQRVVEPTQSAIAGMLTKQLDHVRAAEDRVDVLLAIERLLGQLRSEPAV